jgi:ariadne-1
MSWNKERLIEKYMDKPTNVLVAAGITIPEPPTPPAPVRSHNSSSAGQSSSRRPTRSASKLLGLASKPSPSNKFITPTQSFVPPKFPKPAKGEPFVCPICFDDSPDLHAVSLDCAHSFCSGCWTAYVSSKVRDEAEHCIRCMAEGCALVTPDPFVRSILIPDPGTRILDRAEARENAATWVRFQELVLRHFVASNPNLKYCPYPSCTNTVSCPSAASKSSLTTFVPTVSCGARGLVGQSASQTLLSPQNSFSLAGKEHKFCFGCPIESDHRPVVCPVAWMWLKKCKDDSETANWIKSNTKECTACHSTIEKNGGCKCVVFACFAVWLS